MSQIKNKITTSKEPVSLTLCFVFEIFKSTWTDEEFAQFEWYVTENKILFKA